MKILKGAKLIKEQLKTMPNSPGIYRMLGKEQEVLYVGKARDIKKRVSSYINIGKLPLRLQKMLMQVVTLEITTTETESEALLLEANLIKHLKPRYNILLKDDKSFPFIMLDESHEFPRIGKHRGKKKAGISYFGPFASAGDVNRALSALQKSFLLRPCSDNFFAKRKRPCMEYQIKRCSAPCVGKISAEEYAETVKEAKKFLGGKSREVQERLVRKMESASKGQQYEKAAKYRDRIKALTHIQSGQSINSNILKDADIMAIASAAGEVCVQVFFVRNGQALGNKSFFPINTEGCTEDEIMEAFIARFYQDNVPPALIILNVDLPGRKILESALFTLATKKVRILFPQKGEKLAIVKLAESNAGEALTRRRKEAASEREMLERIEKLFGLEAPPKRIEVYDNSHISGKEAVGAMIVSTPQGFLKNAYRRFKVDPGSKTGGDDYAMMREVFTRRFGRLKREDPDRNSNWPDLVLIDGGFAHMKVVAEVFADLGISQIPFVCISKGPDRNAGREKFHQLGRKTFTLEEKDPLLFYLQRLRDEAHRFAIMAHRAGRTKALKKSALDSVAGIGPKRKKALLNHFGSVEDIKKASVPELEKVDGLNKKTAKTIYEQLHLEN